MKLKNSTYDTLKYVALIALPAIQVFWLTIAKIWSLNYGMEIGATIGAVALLLGTLLGVSTSNYRATNLQDNVDLSDESIIDEDFSYEDTDTDTEEQ